MAKWKTLTQKDYDQIKALCNAGLGNAQIAKIVDRASATVSSIRRSKDFDDYHAIVRAYTAGKTKKSATKLAEEKAIEEKIDEVNVSKAVKVNAHAGTEATSLLRIANALERLADAWEAQPKKGIFR